MKPFKTFSRRTGFVRALRDLLRQAYYTVTALDSISLTVNSGEIVGYLGPNGARKSTTLKIIAGVLLTTEGHVEVNGFIPLEAASRTCPAHGGLVQTTLAVGLEPPRHRVVSLPYTLSQKVTIEGT
ncbi:MAG: ATP-binding cassette domain-containing protein [Candidatus Bipolaricaulota bacterium]|nr:ATP-binding cassette domain-containing protein [Candidatus Bipolaricaulota bacterium]